jgi:CheY-like chemotaxis protein
MNDVQPYRRKNSLQVRKEIPDAVAAAAHWRKGLRTSLINDRNRGDTGSRIYTLFGTVAREAMTELEKKQAKQRDAGVRAERRALLILVADDDRDTVLTLTEVLRHEGHDVTSVLRGDEVLEVARLLRPDAIVLDINMPGMSGYAVARELRDQHGGRGPFLIGVSGVWTKEPERLLGLSVGFDEYLVKPCDPQEIVRLLEPLRVRSAATQRIGLVK